MRRFLVFYHEEDKAILDGSYVVQFSANEVCLTDGYTTIHVADRDAWGEDRKGTFDLEHMLLVTPSKDADRMTIWHRLVKHRGVALHIAVFFYQKDYEATVYVEDEDGFHGVGMSKFCERENRITPRCFAFNSYERFADAVSRLFAETNETAGDEPHTHTVILGETVSPP